MYTRYKNIIGEWKYIENNFNAERSPNDNLKSEIYKNPWGWQYFTLQNIKDWSIWKDIQSN